MRKWRITYLPYKPFPGVREWVFEGSEFDLNVYLQKNHSCGCPDCVNMDWWQTATACEYNVEELTKYED